MPQYLTPGVYVEEVPSAVKPIAGVGTSTAGFIGVVNDLVEMPLRPGRTGVKPPAAADSTTATGDPESTAPPSDAGSTTPEDGVSGATTPEREPDDFYTVAAAGTAVLVDSWDTFRRNFGDVQPGNFVLANAVYGFFNNGGSRAWVTRVADGTDTSAGGTDASPAGTDSSTGTDSSPADTDSSPAGTDTSTGGTDSSDPGSVDSDAGIAHDLVAALESFSFIDEIAIVAIPGATGDPVRTALVDHCENMQGRFAVLDGHRATSPIRADIVGGVRDSSYAALYYPWIQIGTDPKTGEPLFQPPSGHVVGIYARVDATRGVHKAPANEVIRGALGVETLVSKSGQAGLNPGGVNVIRMFGANVTIWGARTTAAVSQPDWKYVSSRRLFIFIRESIEQGLQWTIFEPNAPDLWSKVRRNVTAFLTTVWADGALLGTTPERAFYVRCDETTNPPEVRDLGQLVTEVGIALVNPAEFVVFRISQWAGPAA